MANGIKTETISSFLAVLGTTDISLVQEYLLKERVAAI